MEMMEGGELFHRISQHRHFTEKMASQVTKQVGENTVTHAYHTIPYRTNARKHTHTVFLAL